MSAAMSVSCPQLIHRGQALLVSKEIPNLLLYNSFRVARSFVATLLKPWQLGIRRGGFRCAHFVRHCRSLHNIDPVPNCQDYALATPRSSTFDRIALR